MPTQSSRSVPVILENVYRLISARVDESEQPFIHNMADILYQNLATEDFSKRNDNDLYGALLSLWNLLKQHKKHTPLLRVYDPTVEQNGWRSPHSVVEIIIDDMPFLVDSVRMALNRLGITAHLLLHAPILITRDKEHKITALGEMAVGKKNAARETVFHIEIDRQVDESALQALNDELKGVLADVQSAVDDWQPMQSKLTELTNNIEQTTRKLDKAEQQETVKFLRWVADHNFTLLGYRHYRIVPIAGDYELQAELNTGLGLLHNDEHHMDRRLNSLPACAREQALSSSLLVLTKANSRSRVHRPAYIDYIGIKEFSDDGQVIGEHRFLGLYTSSLYNNSATHVPLLREKVARIMDKSGLVKGSHAFKALLNVLENYPRDELIQASDETLLDFGFGVLQMQERDLTRIFIRRDTYGRFISCMVYVTKERYNTQLRLKTSRILRETFGSNEDVESTTYFSESALARTHYLVRVNEMPREINVKEIEQNLIAAARSWEDKFTDSLLTQYGEAKGKKLARRYDSAFPRSYKENVLPDMALVDVAKLEELAEGQLGMLFYKPLEDSDHENAVNLKLFHRNEPIYLSDMLPVLENMGLRIIGERLNEIHDADGNESWILEFFMLYTGATTIQLEQCQQRFQQALAGIWEHQYENDGLNRLVLSAGLTGHQVVILRAYAKYMRQIGTTFSQQYIEATLAHYPQLAGLLVHYFDARFNPELHDTSKETSYRQQIEEGLEAVANLDDDRIIRRYLELIHATVRTNYYQLTEEGKVKNWLSLKMASNDIPDMPRPVPAFEIFVYSPRVEGIHLRGGKVARGGLRWSDRREDFRTEVLGLVKAQQVKNTVIVPVGAKGGFVCKESPVDGSREAILAEGKQCYRTFIRGLLDITDNNVEGKVVSPGRVVKHDEDDPYLVVAADKGTATFSDIANAISAEYNFWLGDAFASGGSVGYDHKKMGITARGAWESVKRHFREMGIDCQQQDFTCIGIGDMSGDVFGNGMLLSRHTRLLAAFNHMHIFIDPDPDAEASFAERERLFNLPRSTWQDYNSKLISKGGGVFNRSDKSIKLTAQMKKLLGTKASQMTPNELIQLILQAQVDLLWNGGIGTYVKAESEQHSEVGDRANDPIRINGSQLRAKVIGEGGNLGFTQLGRIEFARNGGRVNTDFIDNVGGVDCSDNEVNIKILLNGVVANGELTQQQREKLLFEMTEEVGDLVIDDAYQQTNSISVTEHGGAELLKEQLRFVHALERDGMLDRGLEYLPSDDEATERQASGQGLTRPELAVLTAYAKMALKERLKVPAIIDSEANQRWLEAAFPQPLQQRFHHALLEHPLRGEIIATQLANLIVNEMGFNFVWRMQDETGANFIDIAHAYLLARETYDAADLFTQLMALDNQTSASLQCELMLNLRRILRRSTRWFLRHGNRQLTIQESIDFYRPAYLALVDDLDQYVAAEEQQDMVKVAEGYMGQGVPESLARTLSRLSTLFSVFDIAQLAKRLQQPVALVAEVYFTLGVDLDLHWFLKQIGEQPVANHWQALARASFREELDWQQRSLTDAVLNYSVEKTHAREMIDVWLAAHPAPVQRWHQMISEFRTSRGHEYAKFSVALRELLLLCHAGDRIE